VLMITIMSTRTIIADMLTATTTSTVDRTGI
jgi:hypothetical protein